MLMYDAMTQFEEKLNHRVDRKFWFFLYLKKLHHKIQPVMVAVTNKPRSRNVIFYEK